MSEFKVGDKVKVVNVNGINEGSAYWANGDVVEIIGEDSIDFQVSTPNGDYFFITKDEETDCIELIEPKLTKNKRITALENEVAELKVIVEQLRENNIMIEDVKVHLGIKSPSEVFVSTSWTNDKLIPQDVQRQVIECETKYPPLLTVAGETRETTYAEIAQMVSEPNYNQLRAEIIEKAKAFVDENGGDDYHFEVDAEKRTVFAWKIDGEVYVGLATCSPNDVFNEYLGRAISFGRAEGKDVSEFEQAVQPTIAVGQVVIKRNGSKRTVKKLIHLPYDKLANGENLDGQAFIFEESSGWLAESQITIINDTNAQYEVGEQ